MNLHNKLFGVVTLLVFSGLARADIKLPAVVNCSVTNVTPEGAKFFGFGAGPKTGDRTTLNLAAAEIDGVSFESGAHIGPTVRKHPLKKTKLDFEGMSHFSVAFKSQANGQNYEAAMVGLEEKPGAISVTLDVLEKRALGRLTLNSVELDCVRK